MEAARPWSSPGVWPSDTISKLPFSSLFSSAYSLIARIVSGVTPGASALPLDRCRKYPVVAKRPTHGLPARPRSDHPDGDARLLNRRRQERHLLEPVMLASIGEQLSAPQPGEYLQALVEQLGPNLPVGRLPDLRETTVLQSPEPDRQDETPAGEVVDGDRLAGEFPRSPPGRRRQYGPDLHPLRTHRHRGHHHPGIERIHLPNTDTVPVERAIPTRLLHLTGELSDGARIPRGDHKPVTQQYLLAPTLFPQEYTDPRGHPNHGKQQAEVHTSRQASPDSLLKHRVGGYSKLYVTVMRVQTWRQMCKRRRTAGNYRRRNTGTSKRVTRRSSRTVSGG